MDTGSVPQPKEATLMRPPYDPNATISLPAPCYLIGQMELVYIYFGAGFWIPILALIYVQFARIKRFLVKKLLQNRLTRQHVEGGVEEELEPKKKLAATGEDRFKQLIAAKAKQSRFTLAMIEAASPQSLLGQAMMGVAVLCSGISLAIYLSAVTFPSQSVEYCGTMPNAHQPIDLLANIYLLVYFVIRVLGNEKKLDIVLHSMHSIVDYFTIPGVILSIVLDRYFIGFAFFRAYNCLWIIDLSANRGILRNVNTIQLAHLVLLVMSVLMISSGFLHLVENMGDPWLLATSGPYNGQLISFWRCFLYLYGRVTLLDLSGMRIQTMLGRIIIYGFQILALGIVSKAIPQIILRMKVVPQFFDKTYQVPVLSLHLVVCGHVRVGPMTSFLKEFYNEDRELSEYFQIVILDESEPDDAMSRLLELYYNRLDYRRGSVMKSKDLHRVKVMEAEAVLILADRTTSDIDAEDAANIMRVVSIKNYRENARVIVQVLQYQNKAYLQNIPSWCPKHGDVCLCIAELRLGLEARSCLVPGFSTLMANYFTTRSFSEDRKYTGTWMDEYLHGTSLELYSRTFGQAFHGLTFAQACEFCYRRLKVLLIALHINPDDPLTSPQINPPPSVKITGSTYGYFVADSTVEVDRVFHYCATCHSDFSDLANIKQCKCRHAEGSTLIYESKTSVSTPRSPLLRMLSQRKGTEMESKLWTYMCHYPNADAKRTNQSKDNPSTDQYDSTGNFHWCTPIPFSTCVLDRHQAALTSFRDHIVLCILSQPYSQNIGIASFVLPLRASSFRREDLRDIVVLGDPELLEREWPYLCNLPGIYVVQGSALNRSDLRAVHLNTCQMCVMLGAPGSSDPNAASGSAAIDKSVILATLNARAMRFSDEENKMHLHSRSNYKGVYEDHKITKVRENGYEVPLLTDLTRESNVQFLESDDMGEDLPGTEFYLTQPYAGGRAFATSVLDMLMITSFFTPSIVKIFHSLVFGGASLELERLLAEGAGLIGGPGISKTTKADNQVVVRQIPVDSPPFRVYAGLPYGGLFLDALVNTNLLILGLYRRIEDGEGGILCDKRYVVSSPPESFVVRASDLVFVLQRADWQSPESTTQQRSVSRLADVNIP